MACLRSSRRSRRAHSYGCCQQYELPEAALRLQRVPFCVVAVHRPLATGEVVARGTAVGRVEVAAGAMDDAASGSGGEQTLQG